MSEEIYGMVQILELTGKAAGAMFKAIRLSAHGAKKGLDLKRLAVMQIKMRLHYGSHNQGKHKTMSLRTLEKLTGGQYAILNIPFENEKELIEFYDRLKKLKVSFAELPDLNVGDGFTQIAYNPQEADKIKLVVEYYKEKMQVEAEEISLEKYEQLGGEKGKQILNELARKGYEKETHIQHLQQIRDRNKDINYQPISLNIDSLLVQETPDSYLCYVPHTNKTETLLLNKSECVLLDDGQTIYTHLRKDNPEHQKFLDKFNKVKPEKMKQSERIRLSDTDAMPNFKMGQEEKEVPVQEEKEFLSSLDRYFESPEKGWEKEKTNDFVRKNSTPTEETIQNALHLEELKGKLGNPEYIPLTFSLEDSLVAETKNIYVVKLPNNPNKDTVEMLTIPKKDAVLSENKKSIQTFIKKEESTEISLHNVRTGKAAGKAQIKNIDLLNRVELPNKKSPAQAKELVVKEFLSKTAKIRKD